MYASYYVTESFHVTIKSVCMCCVAFILLYFSIVKKERGVCKCVYERDFLNTLHPVVQVKNKCTSLLLKFYKCV